MPDKRIAVAFWLPIDPDDWVGKGITLSPHDNYHKRIGGETFDTLSLAPSVNIEGHWHGNIINGELQP